MEFRSENQNFLHLDFYQAKFNIYFYRQDDITNKDYLQQLKNLIVVATEYNGCLNDKAISDIVTE